MIAGHVDSFTGPAVFFRLKELGAGDRVEVAGFDGRSLAYTVEKVERYPKNNFPTNAVYGPAPERSSLRLITCGGDFDRERKSYNDNIVVFANLAAA